MNQGGSFGFQPINNNVRVNTDTGFAQNSYYQAPNQMPMQSMQVQNNSITKHPAYGANRGGSAMYTNFNVETSEYNQNERRQLNGGEGCCCCCQLI